MILFCWTAPSGVTETTEGIAGGTEFWPAKATPRNTNKRPAKRNFLRNTTKTPGTQVNLPHDFHQSLEQIDPQEDWTEKKDPRCSLTFIFRPSRAPPPAALPSPYSCIPQTPAGRRNRPLCPLQLADTPSYPSTATYGWRCTSRDCRQSPHTTLTLHTRRDALARVL